MHDDKGGKMIFSFCFLGFFLKPKTSKVQNIVVFFGFLGINFWYKFCTQTIWLLFHGQQIKYIILLIKQFIKR